MFMYIKQLPESENDVNGGPNWKWIVTILIAICGFAGSWYISTVQGQFNEQDRRMGVVHNRISKMDEEKVDKTVLSECIKRLDEKIDDVHADVKELVRLSQKERR
jgi:hypothetical protein